VRDRVSFETKKPAAKNTTKCPRILGNAEEKYQNSGWTPNSALPPCKKLNLKNSNQVMDKREVIMESRVKVAANGIALK